MENEKANKPKSEAHSREFEEIELPYEGIDDRNVGLGRRLEASEQQMASSTGATGGDIYSNQYQAEVEGDEAVGGTTPTPDQNVTEELEKAVGLEVDDRSFLRTIDELEQRDDRRWELDPSSSDDYQERRE